MKTNQEIESICKKLKPILGEQADSLWHFYLTEDKIGREKLAEDIEILEEKYLKSPALTQPEILLPPPSTENSGGAYYLGDAIYKNQKQHSLYLKTTDFIKQMGIFAITGEGKTNLAYQLCLELFKTNTPFMVIDWKRSWRNLLSVKDIHPELKNVEVFTIGRNIWPFKWNPFRAPPGADKELWINTIAEALEKSHLSGPGVAYYFNRIFPKLFHNKKSKEAFYPNFFDGLKEIEKIPAIQRELKWKQTAQRIFQSFCIGESSRTFNNRNPIKLEELLSKPIILELDLEMPKPLRVFFSEIILRWIHLYRLGQGETDKLRHVLFLEECHNLFQSPSLLNNANNSSLENVYREIRGFGQGIVSITQHPSLLPVYLLGNCHTQIYLGLQHADDIMTARKSLFLKPDEEVYLNLLKVGECIVKIKNRVEPCLIKTPLVPIKKGVVNDEWLKTHDLSCQFWKFAWQGDANHPRRKKLNELINSACPSGAKVNKGVIYQQPNRNKGLFTKQETEKNQVNTPPYLQPLFAENNPVSSCKKVKSDRENHPKPPANISKNMGKPALNISQDKLLIDIFQNPFSSITARYKRLNLNPKYGNRLKEALISDGCVKPRKVITNKYRLKLFDITKKGSMVLRDLGHEMEFKSEGIVHKFWKNKIAEFYKSKGYKVAVEEYFVNGRPDLIVDNSDRNIKMAVEVETGKSDYIANIRKCLEAGFDEVVCVAVSKEVKTRIIEGLRKERIFSVKINLRVVGDF